MERFMRRALLLATVLTTFAAVPLRAATCDYSRFHVDEWMDHILDVEFSPDGQRMVYWRTADEQGNEGFEGSIYTSKIDGNDEKCLTCGMPGAETTPVYSADGQKIAFVASFENPSDAGGGGGGPGGDIWVMNADGTPNSDGEKWTRLTVSFADGTNFRPRWSHSGRRLFWTQAPPDWFFWKLKIADYVEDEGGPRLENIQIVNADPTDAVDPRNAGVTPASPYHLDQPDTAWYESADWTPTDDGVVFTGTTDNSWNFELYRVNFADGAKTRLTRHPELDESGHFSPNGERIAFISSRDNPSIISVYEYPSWFLGLPPAADMYSILFYAVSAWSQPVLSQGVDIYLMKPDGTAVERLTEFGPEVVGGGVPNWNHDGTMIATTAFFHGNVNETPRITTAPQRTGFHTFLVKFECSK